MCRHLLITARTLPGMTEEQSSRAKVDLVNFGMMLGVLDENQDSGWGVGTGRGYYKFGGPYHKDQNFEWMDFIAPENIIQAHVRKASAQTDLRSTAAAHPYVFDINGHILSAAHNGYMQGTTWPKAGENWPNTDSYRAFMDLVRLLEKDENITPALIETWLNNYHNDSQYVFTLLWKGDLWTVRGPGRTLFAARFGDGYLIHTSKDVLKVLLQYALRTWGVDGGVIQEVELNSLIKFTLGSPVIEAYPIKPTYRPRYVAPARSDPPSWIQTQGTTTNPIVPAAGASSTDAPKPVAGTPNDAAQQSVAPAATTQYIITPNMPNQQAFNILLSKCAPIRASMLRMWISVALGYMTANEQPELDRVQSAPSTELMFFGECIAPLERPVFTARQKMLINAWNHSVGHFRDVDAQQQVFGNYLFFFTPELLDLALTDQQATYGLEMMLGMFKGGALRVEIWKALDEYLKSLPIGTDATVGVME